MFFESLGGILLETRDRKLKFSIKKKRTGGGAASFIIGSVIFGSLLLGNAGVVHAESITVNGRNFNQYFIGNPNGKQKVIIGGQEKPVRVKLTEDLADQVGGITLNRKVSLLEDFTWVGKVGFGSKQMISKDDEYGNTQNADGISFILHTGTPGQLGATGANMGAGGLPNVLGLKLDTYRNKEARSNPRGKDLNNQLGWEADPIGKGEPGFGEIIKTVWDTHYGVSNWKVRGDKETYKLLPYRPHRVWWGTDDYIPLDESIMIINYNHNDGGTLVFRYGDREKEKGGHGIVTWEVKNVKEYFKKLGYDSVSFSIQSSTGLYHSPNEIELQAFSFSQVSGEVTFEDDTATVGQPHNDYSKKIHANGYDSRGSLEDKHINFTDKDYMFKKKTDHSVVADPYSTPGEYEVYLTDAGKKKVKESGLNNIPNIDEVHGKLIVNPAPRPSGEVTFEDDTATVGQPHNDYSKKIHANGYDSRGSLEDKHINFTDKDYMFKKKTDHSVVADPYSTPGEYEVYLTDAGKKKVKESGLNNIPNIDEVHGKLIVNPAPRPSGGRLHKSYGSAPTPDEIKNKVLTNYFEDGDQPTVSVDNTPLPDGKHPGEVKVPVTVTYPDGGKGHTFVTVITGSPESDKYTPQGGQVDKPYGEAPTPKDIISKVTTGYPTQGTQPKVTVDPKDLPNGLTPGEFDVPVTVTYPDTSTDKVNVKVVVGQPDSNRYTANGGKIENPFGRPTTQTDVIGKVTTDYPKLSPFEPIVTVDAPSKLPDGKHPGTVEVPVTVTYPDGSMDHINVTVTTQEEIKTKVGTPLPSAPIDVVGIPNVDGNGSTVTGKGTPGYHVVVRNGKGQEIGSGTVNPDGSFTVHIGEPVNPYMTVVQGNEGQISDPTPVDAIKVMTGTPLPSAPTDVVGIPNVDGNGSTVTGKGTPGYHVVVRNGKGQEIGSGTVNPDGSFTVHIGEPVNPYMTVVQGNGGPISDPSLVGVVKVKTGTPLSRPAAPTDVVVVPNSDGNGSEVSGKGTSGAKVTVYNNGTPVGTGTVDGNGDFSVEVMTPVEETDKVTVTQEKDGQPSDPADAKIVDFKLGVPLTLDNNNTEKLQKSSAVQKDKKVLEDPNKDKSLRKNVDKKEIKTLPQTGESDTLASKVLGVTLVSLTAILGLATNFLKRRKEDDR